MDPLTNLSCPWSCSLALQAGKGAAEPPVCTEAVLGAGPHTGLGQFLAQLKTPEDKQELGDKENPGMLGSHSPQHLKAWPDMEQPPMDMELTQDPQPTLGAPSSDPLSSPELLQPPQGVKHEEKSLKILRVSQADCPQQSPPSLQAEFVRIQL